MASTPLPNPPPQGRGHIKVALITGSSRGLGRAIALAFANGGYTVAVHYHANKKEADQTTSLIKKTNADTASFQADVRDSSAVNRLVKEVSAKWGRIDVLVNNAGSVRNQLISKMTDDQWREPFATNLDGAFFSTRAVIPVMRSQKGGSIINIASYAAQKGVRGAANYAAAKAALVTFTKNTALEEGAFNIRANTVLPGFHVTDINRDTWAKYEGDIRKQHLLSELPDREEMAEFVARVAGLKTVTGQVFAFESRL